MGWTPYLILIIFGLFVLLSILNPNFSCFGRRLKSPFYPLYRGKKRKQVKTHDYGFYLVDDKASKNQKSSPENVYFLDDTSSSSQKNLSSRKKKSSSPEANDLSSYKVDSE
ncbi:MAG: hypothetical protein B5M54_05820 [Candidatus Aminicenantes bacterium 4484_214]|nr:MAG: hypothetical protein B5M54_05820 [Candidatus Aminicenantes bacterium 4484_214]RLE09958.1 MAG: hypothetical protein DRJ06_01890 [Candidatus Aminicenantes bacterium]HDJ23472.1 hypothetical protein [Candidatus Aminicenantes bacterium]